MVKIVFAKSTPFIVWTISFAAPCTYKLNYAIQLYLNLWFHRIYWIPTQRYQSWLLHHAASCQISPYNMYEAAIIDIFVLGSNISCETTSKDTVESHNSIYIYKVLQN